MAELLTDVDGQLLHRLDDCAALQGASRSQLVERALRQYLDRADGLAPSITAPESGPEAGVDWSVVKDTLVASHCPYRSCPHHGSCPIELCPL